ncbi:Protein NETWORKED 4B [Cardamine amara subsp. amara]|uniref:Protein NETWORKED 4B n=1 Tax=Cardamine amara subsp. amara TaxID=228776 RepID=A0ABD0ZC57_CARAN
MDSTTETGPENVDSSLRPHNSKPLAEILTEINQNVQSMLKLIEDGEPESTEKFLCLYQSLGETYNDLNQELLNGLLKFDFKLSSSDHNNASKSSSFVFPMAHLSSSKSVISPSLESGTSYSSPKHQLVSQGTTTSSEMLQSLRLNGEVEKNPSAFQIADIFCAELETGRRELEARNIEIETEKRHVLELESKLSDSSYKIENLESELEVIKECLGVSEAEVSKLLEMLSECETEKAKLQPDNADLVDSLRAELKSRDIQIEQMEECLNQVCFKDTEIMPESGTNKNVVEELRARGEDLEKQVELQRNVITEIEEEKREAIKQLCFSLDHYKSKYLELVRSLSDNKKGMPCSKHNL